MSLIGKKEMTAKLNNADLLVKYIETMTHSGLPALDQELMGKLKGICKKEPPLIDMAYTALIKQLRKKHSQVRLSTFQIIVELFKRSHNFRQKIINNLEEILELTAEIDSKNPLPLPKEAASTLKTLALRTVQKWKNEFGSTYKQFLICYNYLSKCKRIDFDGMEREILEAEAARHEREQQVQRARQQVFNNFVDEFNEKVPDIEASIESINNCISLLLPPPEDFFVPNSTADEPDIITSNSADPGEEFDMRLHGINPSYNLVINLDQVKKLRVEKTEENSAIIENLKENISIVKKRYFSLIKKWEEKVSNYSQDDSYDEKLKNLKKALEKSVNKLKEVYIEGIDDDDDDDDDMEEVVKEGYEPNVLPIFQNPGPSTSNIGNQVKNPCDKAVKKENDDRRVEGKVGMKKIKRKAEETSIDDSPKSRKERLLAIAPKLPYDNDLYHWEDDKLTAPTLISMKMGNPKFWGSGDAGDVDEIPDPGGVASLRTRVIEFTGQFQAVDRSCRFPITDGKLCPRRDRVRCPFHGKIVPRDDSGKCLNPDDEPTTSRACESDEEQEEKEPVPDWQDPVLLAQLKAATGIDLKMPEKKKKGPKKKKKKKGGKKGVRRKKDDPSADALEDIKKRNFPGIASIVTRKNDAKTRLKKKIFNRRAMKRVADAVDKIERRKHKDKFGDQFNYYLTT